MSEKTILVWFRNDLRVHDNEILLEASRRADKVLPVYCFDPFYFTASAYGHQKTGSVRSRFLLESVADLRSNLRALGSELVIVRGDPAELIPRLAWQYKVSEVYHHREVAFQETAISEAVETALWKIKLNLRHFIGHTLYHKEDLPFPIKDIPDSFTLFKKKIERESKVRPCFETPDHIKTPLIADAGELPSLAELGISPPFDDLRADFHYQGGETTALQQMHQYIQMLDHSSPAKNAKYHTEKPSRLSAWISLGCLSQRMVYHEALKQTQGTNASGSTLIIELLWRDYFRFMFKKYGRQFFSAGGFKDEAPETADNQQYLFEQWTQGHTGVPYIDAAMHELSATGYINNFKRQAVAAFLINNLKVEWLKGAAFFEEKLIDYSPASNWGNWAFIAGVANDIRDDRYFPGVKQADTLETDSEFISTWLADSSSQLVAI